MSGDRVEWYEASAAGVQRWTLGLESGAWTYAGRAGCVSSEVLPSLRQLAALVRPEDTYGGAHLSAAGAQDLVVTLGRNQVVIKGSAAEDLAQAPQDLVNAVFAAMKRGSS